MTESAESHVTQPGTLPPARPAPNINDQRLPAVDASRRTRGNNDDGKLFAWTSGIGHEPDHGTSLPDGTRRATGYQDQSHEGDRSLHKITVATTKRNDHLTFDFTRHRSASGND